MAVSYHINPDTGRVNICRAKIMCDFAVDGVPPEHYATKDDAKAGSEKMLSEQYGGSFGNKESRTQKTEEATSSTTDFEKVDVDTLPEQLEPHKAIVFSNYTENIFYNTQGKAAFIDYDGKLTVYKKDGKIDNNSSLHNKDIDELKQSARIGGWYQVEKPSDENISEEDNNEVIRMEHIRDAGYPLTSHLNPDPDQEYLKLIPQRRNKFGMLYESPILDTDTKANPHESLKNNEYLGDMWDEDMSVEVWTDRNNPKRTILVATAGNHVHKPGESSHFIGDQSRRTIGVEGGWQMIGAFHNKEGGEAIGEIPNKKMPLYTYK